VVHAAFCEMVESNMEKLKEWLDERLQRHEDLLKLYRDSHEVRSSPGGIANPAVKDSPLLSPSSQRKQPEEPLSPKTPKTLLSPSSQRKPEELLSMNPLLGPSSRPKLDALPDLVTVKEEAAVKEETDFETLTQLTKQISTELPGSISENEELRTTATAIIEPDGDPPRLVSFKVALPGSAFEENGDHETMESELSVVKEMASTEELVRTPMSRASNMSMSTTPIDVLDSEWHSKLMDVFDQLDLDRSGSIDRKEFAEAFEEVGMPSVKTLTVFTRMDRSSNGLIDRMEWLRMVEDAARGSEHEIDILGKFLQRLAKRQRSRGKIYETDRTRRPCLIIRHDSFYRMAWDMMIMLLLGYICVSMPYALGFGQSDALDTVDRVFDMIFCVDVVLNFRTSYCDRDETIVVDGCQIAKKYLKSWFLLDFVSSVPFDMITAGIMPNLTPARLLKIGKIAKVMKLLRISKMLSVLAESELMEKVDEKSTSRTHQTFVRIMKLVCMAFLVGHWLACFGAAVDTSSLDVYFSGDPEEPTDLQRYLAAMYWAMTTLSTVGYGDITPKTDSERAYAMVAMIIGGALYGYVIGSVTSIVTDMDLNARAFHERMELIQSWLDRHDEIPKLLRRRLRKHFKRTLAAKAAMDDSSVVSELSPELRSDTAFFLINENVRHHCMFNAVPNSALAKLVEVLQKNHASSNEFVVKFGDPGIAMYILVDGVARYDKGVKWYPANAESKGSRFEKIVPGDSFGEEIVFSMEENYLYSVVTISNCELHSISEDGFQERFQNMPELTEIMRSGFLRSRGMYPGESEYVHLVNDGMKHREVSAVVSHYAPPSMQRNAITNNPYRPRIKLPRRFGVGKKKIVRS